MVMSGVPVIVAVPTRPLNPRTSRRLTGKLSAARDNVRFADKRIADLEIQLTEQKRGTAPEGSRGQTS